MNGDGRTRRVWDISVPVSERTAVWPGDTPFSLRWVMRLCDGMSCNVSAVTMSVHTGSHTDAPYHFDEAGPRIAGVPLEKYVGPATVIHVRSRDAVHPSDLAGVDLRRARRLLFRTLTNLDPERWNDAFAFLTEDSARLLAAHDIDLVGIDTPSVDFMTSRSLAVHHILLGSGIAILEGLDLSAVPEGEYELIALPLRLLDADSSPVRAILREL